jgi:hypothetical protein
MAASGRSSMLYVTTALARHITQACRLCWDVRQLDTAGVVCKVREALDASADIVN